MKAIANNVSDENSEHHVQLFQNKFLQVTADDKTNGMLRTHTKIMK